MRMRSAFVLGAALLYAGMAFGQSDHKVEVTVDYSYVHANPQNNNVIPTFSLNGGGGSAAFTYNVGPILKYRTSHFEPLVEALFGGAHSNFYTNVFKGCANCLTASNSPSNNAFDFLIGGGIDIPVTPKIAIRPYSLITC